MIEQRAHISAEDLWATTHSDVEATLAALNARVVRRQRRTRVGLLAAAVVAIGLATTGGAVLTHRANHGAPPSHPGPSQNQPETYCPTGVPVTCLAHHTYRFPLVQPLVWQIPAGYVFRSRDPATRWLVESYRTDGHPGESGVTVMEGARASTPNGNGPAADVTDTPEASCAGSRTDPSSLPVRCTRHSSLVTRPGRYAPPSPPAYHRGPRTGTARSATRSSPSPFPEVASPACTATSCPSSPRSHCPAPAPPWSGRGAPAQAQVWAGSTN